MATASDVAKEDDTQARAIHAGVPNKPSGESDRCWLRPADMLARGHPQQNLQSVSGRRDRPVNSACDASKVGRSANTVDETGNGHQRRDAEGDVHEEEQSHNHFKRLIANVWPPDPPRMAVGLGPSEAFVNLRGHLTHEFRYRAFTNKRPDELRVNARRSSSRPLHRVVSSSVS